MKKSFIKENVKFRDVCTTYTPIIITICAILFMIGIIIDVVYEKEVGFTTEFSGKITLIIIGVFTAIYWIPKIIFIL